MMDNSAALYSGKEGKVRSMDPQKFALWLFIISIVMLFASLTSAYMVKKAEGNWLLFELPTLLWVNSGIIIVSSVFVQWAYVAAKKDNLGNLGWCFTSRHKNSFQ